MKLSLLNQRRWRNFKSNRRAYWSLMIFSVLFVVCMCAELVANDKPLLISYRGDIYTPITTFYPETTFGGDFETLAEYVDPGVQCLIVTGGLPDCFDDPEGVMEDAADGSYQGEGVYAGWILWPPVPYSFNTINYGIMFDIWTLLIFGIFGWLAVKLRLEIAPFIIGFILGPSAEIYFVKSLESFGDLTIFFTKSWIAGVLWVLIIRARFLSGYPIAQSLRGA